MKLKTLACLSLITLVASLCPASHAQTFSVIHNFTGGGDGAYPGAGVTIKGGSLFGTTIKKGGANNAGTVYEITHVGSEWVTVPIYLFGGGKDGSEPTARVVFGPDGHLYGTTSLGGSGSQLNGTVFNLTPPLSICKTANCFWKENVLYTFAGPPSDGSGPGYGDPAWDRQGDIYGTTFSGGQNDVGTVYELTLSGSTWTEGILYSFSGPDGQYPAAGVILDKNGNLFGTTYQGGLYGFGTIFELTHTPETGWTETVLYNFQDGGDGGYPYAGLIFDSSGNLFGATSDGGSGQGGTVFELSPSGNTWIFKLLYSLSGFNNCGPQAPLTMDATGSLDGTTLCDGTHNQGNVFKLTNQNSWTYTSLHDFTDGNDGAEPFGNVTLDTDGTLYGTTSVGGSQGVGVVWMIKP